jgi:hypothetical protein
MILIHEWSTHLASVVLRQPDRVDKAPKAKTPAGLCGSDVATPTGEVFIESETDTIAIYLALDRNEVGQAPPCVNYSQPDEVPGHLAIQYMQRSKVSNGLIHVRYPPNLRPGRLG